MEEYFRCMNNKYVCFLHFLKYTFASSSTIYSSSSACATCGMGDGANERDGYDIQYWKQQTLATVQAKLGCEGDVSIYYVCDTKSSMKQIMEGEETEEASKYILPLKCGWHFSNAASTIRLPGLAGCHSI